MDILQENILSKQKYDTLKHKCDIQFFLTYFDIQVLKVK